MKTARLYSLYEMVDGTWVRRSEAAFKKETAIRVFQDALLGGFFSGKKVELRPVPKVKI